VIQNCQINIKIYLSFGAEILNGLPPG